MFHDIIRVLDASAVRACARAEGGVTDPQVPPTWDLLRLGSGDGGECEWRLETPGGTAKVFDVGAWWGYYVVPCRAHTRGSPDLYVDRGAAMRAAEEALAAAVAQAARRWA
ncbi:conserved protein of unknown function (plasmid) [Rhodovastum atsumiense]|uniref:Uncharacterized protein n=2 Tax=Rhodovastum atsumiense TaxID=504468 RepID=A0A5M6IWK8_9PROT|nr:hypothetical protein [Rhodovastum atsumiense]KAA5611848.1 hypothetical protein F1189_12495 [Rhodovastum atsumiense]CAH2606179.1 conserved protein of unknown function [Rhodovastum atsumiense]